MRKFKVIHLDSYDIQSTGLQLGDIVELKYDGGRFCLFKLPKHLYGRGHNASVTEPHLKLKSYNYWRLNKNDVKEIKEEK